MTINGSLPGPTLRWREGDNVTLRVRNRLAEDTSIHWHGIILPANMDGVPGLSFEGIAPGGLYEYRFKVRQNGTYWYHSHSGLQEQAGVYGALVIDAREPEPFSYDRDYVVLLSDWSDEKPQRILAKLKKQSGLLQLPQAHRRRLHRRRQRQRLGRDPGRPQDVGRDEDESHRSRRRQRLHLYLPAQRTAAGRQLDRPVPPRRKAPPALRQRLGDELFRRPHSRPEDDRGGRRRTARPSRSASTSCASPWPKPTT